MFRVFHLFVLIFSAMLLVSSTLAQPIVRDPESGLGWQPENFGAYTTSLCSDARGGIWVGTEEKGVWRFDGAAKSWRAFTVDDGLGDDTIYALATDSKGRVWAGHVNHGVSVWNGAEWKNYDVTAGPLGERVFDIAVNPRDGDVWLATSAGLARYHAEKEWLYYHRGTTMPADQLSAITFDKQGTLYGATQCEGIAIATAEDDYKTWKRVESKFSKMPLVAAGKGLPGNVINDVLAGADGTIWAATQNGLARSTDGGNNWTFLRGEDWQARVDGLYENPNAVAPLPEVEPIRPDGPLLAADNVSCLAEDAAGRLWIGYFRKGFEVRDAKTNRRLQGDTEQNNQSIRAILPISGAQPAALLARYGGTPGGIGSVGRIKAEGAAQPAAPFPAEAKPPSAERLLFLMDKVKTETRQFAYLGQDWATQGNWLGRYGQQHALLCAMHNPLDYTAVAIPGYAVNSRVGPHIKQGYGGRYGYIYDLTSTERRALFMPRKAVRRPAEWNDGTWQEDKYPSAWEGPDLWAQVTVPEGRHRVALYFCNANAHGGNSRFRDYVIEMKKHEENRNLADASTALARARVREFWSGVYHSFLVTGPGSFDFKIARNGSFVTILQGVFISRMDAAPSFNDYAPPARETIENPLAQRALELWTATESGNPHWMREAQVTAYRAMAATEQYPNWLKKLRWQLPLWTTEDDTDFENFAKRAASAPKPEDKND